MSLPPATKDISSHPTKYSVADPTNKAFKEADIKRKIKLYGIIQAFRKGNLPSNSQIDHTLRYVLDHSPVDLKELSPEGRKLVQDTRDIIATARLMVQEKNADELFQNFIWNTRSVDTDSLKTGDLREDMPVDNEKVQADSDQAVKHLRALLSLVLTNSEVRKLLSDFSVIGRDILSKGVMKASDALAPSEEDLRNTDQSAPSDQFITEGGRVAGPNETPVLEGRVPGTDHNVRMHPRDDQPQLQNPDGTTRTLGVGEVRNQAMGARDQAVGQMSEQVQPTTQKLQDTALEFAKAEPEEQEQKKQGMMEKMRQMRNTVRDGITDRIPDKQKDNVDEKLNRTQRFFSEEYFPEERRDQFIFRGKKVIIECQKYDDYQEAIRWLLNISEEYTQHGHNAGGPGKGYISHLANEPKLNLCIAELRTLLERFADDTSLDIIGDAINALIDDSKRDEGLKAWFKAVNTYIRKVLLEPGYVLDPDCNTQAKHLRETGRFYFDEKYRLHFDNLFNSIGNWFKAMGDDPINHQFGEDWARLTKDLLFDNEGSLKFKPELWNDIRKVILPKLIEEIGYVPIPRIEYSDDSLDLVVENLTLQGNNLFPNVVTLEANNYLKFSPYNAIGDDHRTHIKLNLQQIQADMRDVAFYYRKKTGIKMKDSGLADVLLGGEGLSATIELVSTKKDKSSVFRVHNVHVKVDTLKFAIRDSKHDFLYKTLRPLATGLIKRQIEKAMKDAMTTGFEYLDGRLVAVRDRMDAAKASDTERRTDVLKEIFNKKKEGSINSTNSKSQFRIVADKRDSLLPKEGNPSGWVNRTAAMEKVASTGNEWRSEAFQIV